MVGKTPHKKSVILFGARSLCFFQQPGIIFNQNATWTNSCSFLTLHYFFRLSLRAVGLSVFFFLFFFFLLCGGLLCSVIECDGSVRMETLYSDG